jgi:ferredoxin-NADP reductase
LNKPVHPTFSPALISSKDAAPGIKMFRFASPAGFKFIPGQFIMFHFHDDPNTWRAYSVCSSPSAAHDYFEVTVGMVGPFSERLAALVPGKDGGLVARGPFGKWVYDGAIPHAVLVSGGTGVTPFRAMILGKIGAKSNGRITLCCAAKTREGLLYRDEYPGWREHGINVNERVTQPGERWTADSVFAAANDAAAVYFLCGPNKMVGDMRNGLLRLGVPSENIRSEKWGDYTDLF